MTLARFKELAVLPGIVVGLLIALYALFDLMGTGKRLDGHVVIETLFHRKADSAVTELHGHATDQEKLLEALVRGECIENPRANLARQGLLAKCRALGITP